MKKLVFLFFFLISSVVYADNGIHIAVATNFFATLKVLAKDFTQQTGIKISISNGSTGMLYAQIKRGAPFDMFFAGDSERPELLEQQGLIEKNSRFTYAIGKLVVWSTNKQLSADLSKLDLKNKNLRFVAIANPKTAPYGVAAVAVLKHYGLYQQLQHDNKIAYGENIGATFHYIASGNAQIGLIAKSYLFNASSTAKSDKIMQGEVVEVAKNLYPPLTQQAVILKGKNSAEIKQFLQFFHSKKIKNIINSHGYGVG